MRVPPAGEARGGAGDQHERPTDAFSSPATFEAILAPFGNKNKPGHFSAPLVHERPFDMPEWWCVVRRRLFRSKTPGSKRSSNIGPLTPKRYFDLYRARPLAKRPTATARRRQGNSRVGKVFSHTSKTARLCVRGRSRLRSPAQGRHSPVGVAISVREGDDVGGPSAAVAHHHGDGRLLPQAVQGHRDDVGAPFQDQAHHGDALTQTCAEAGGGELVASL